MMINVVNPSQSQNFSGLVLLSNPQNQIDTEFEQCVIAVVQHQRDKGAMGLILNRPLRLMLNDFDANQWEHFDDVPVFKGGPVEQKRLILTAIDWTPNNHFLKWHLGLQARQASQLLSQNESIVLRAYCGYVGWREGQLEEELDKNLAAGPDESTRGVRFRQQTIVESNDTQIPSRQSHDQPIAFQSFLQLNSNGLLVERAKIHAVLTIAYMRQRLWNRVWNTVQASLIFNKTARAVSFCKHPLF